MHIYIDASWSDLLDLAFTFFKLCKFHTKTNLLLPHQNDPSKCLYFFKCLPETFQQNNNLTLTNFRYLRKKFLFSSTVCSLKRSNRTKVLFLRRRSFEARNYTATARHANTQQTRNTQNGGIAWKAKAHDGARGRQIGWRQRRESCCVWKRAGSLGGTRERDDRSSLISLAPTLSPFSHSRSIYRFRLSRFARDRCEPLSLASARCFCNIDVFRSCACFVFRCVRVVLFGPL